MFSYLLFAMLCILGPDCEFEIVARSIPDTYEREDRRPPSREVKGRLVGGWVPSIWGDYEHPHPEIHEERWNSQIWRLRGHHSKPDSSILYVHSFCVLPHFLIKANAKISI